MKIQKQASVLTAGTPDAEQLEKINRQAKSPLKAEEVYVFSVRLCDDQPDRDHERFKREMLTARDLGCRLVVLVENTDGIKSLEDLAEWREPMGHLAMRKRSSKSVTARQIHGSRLAKACKTMEDRYGVRFAFCHPNESAESICRILGGGADA